MSMTRMVLLAAAVAAPVLRAGADEPKADANTGNKLIGTWKLVSAKYGGKESQFPAGWTMLKHVTPSQFMWVTHDPDGKVTRAAGGSYTLKGDEYAETPEYGIGADFQVIKGGTHTFKWKVEGNKWLHTGKLSNGLTIDEVWERVEK
jgi:hypothetical protein